ncbi:MAG: SusC/RagA family TonB-linked outer membrane protein [Saprospiraceae bacterium]|nr:SusC/RagA family TonB-linked outer membrane protein [Saprospiraceae bacterium]MBP7800965.1 SusC/RagA family TonB-linked outer membrane protein [Saprospiraceae bacterium]
MKLIYLLILSVAAFSAEAQRVLKGSVLDQNRDPLTGVNILVKGGSNGTVSDENGAYSISIQPNEKVLVFSYTGFTTQEVSVGTSNTLDIVLVEGVQLSEMVVTALGISREKKELGYAIEEIKGEQLQRVGESDPLRAMQGKIAGVNIVGSSSQPGSATRLTIRGLKSFFGNNQALYVVDGIPFDASTNGASFQLTGGGAYSNRLADLDPNNIESINVLKGATAAALYGSRASRGVIIINTKTGSLKKGDNRLSVDVSSSINFEKIASLPNYQNTYGNGTGFIYAQANGSWGAPFPGAVPYPTIDSINHWYRGAGYTASFNRLVEAGDPRVTSKVPYRAYPDNVKDVFNTGSLRDNSVTIRGGNQNTSMAMTFSRVNHTGIFPNSDFGKTSFSLGANSKFETGLRVGGNFSFINSLQKGLQGGAIGSASTASFMARTLYLGRAWDLQGQPFEDPVTHESLFMVSRASADNPLWSSKYNGFSGDVNRYVVNVNAGYQFNKWLDLDYRIGINQYNQRDLEWFRPGSQGAGGLGSVVDLNTNFRELESTVILTAKHRFNDRWAMEARAGHNLNDRQNRAQGIKGTQMLDFNIIDVDNTVNQVSAGGDLTKQRLLGMFGELTADYNSYLFFTLAGRNDWSSTLPRANNHYFYPSASMAFVFSEALKMSDNPILNSGKIRLNWSKVGSPASPYSLKPIYLLNLGESNGLTAGIRDIDFPFGGIASSTLSNTLFDPNLKPEFTTDLEAGVDLEFFKSRAELNISLFKSTSTDQISQLALPTASGYDVLLTNFGALQTKGAEVSLKLNPISNKSFDWNITANFTKYKTIVTELREGTDELVIRPLFAGGITPVLRVGQPYGIFKGTVSARDEEGNLLIDRTNGQIINGINDEIIGDPNPDFTLGLVNNISWKGISLGTVFDWKQGGDLYSETINAMLGRGVLAFQGDREKNAVIKGVYGNPVPKDGKLEALLDESGKKIPNQTMIEVNDLWFGSTFGTNGQDEWTVFDATLFRLREVSLAYSLPASLFKKGIKGASVSITGRNLWYKAPYLPKDTNFDPETSTFGDSNYQGFEFQNLPSIKRYGASINLKF